VKAAWIYNDLLKYWGLNNFEKIKSSEKIKWVYLKPNTLNVKQIGFKVKADFGIVRFIVFSFVNKLQKA